MTEGISCSSLSKKNKSQVEIGSVINDYKFVEKIGAGGFSDVYKVLSNKFQTYFCAKVYTIRQSNVSRAWESFDREVKALERLDHPHVIRMYDHFCKGQSFILILEFCPNGSLQDEIKKYGPYKFPTNRLFTVISQLLSALSYLHSNNTAHLDVKPQNVLFDQFGRVKLADFGLSLYQSTSVSISNDSMMKTANSGKCKNFDCSLAYAAPEVIDKIAFNSFKADIWSTGVTILHALNGVYPFPYVTRHQLICQLMIADYKIVNEEDTPTILKELIAKMIVVKPEMRIDMQVAKEMIDNAMQGCMKSISSSTIHAKLNVINSTNNYYNINKANCARRLASGGLLLLKQKMRAFKSKSMTFENNKSAAAGSDACKMSCSLGDINSAYSKIYSISSNGEGNEFQANISSLIVPVE